MKTSSPLRYPGGKSALAGLLRGIRQLNRLGDRSVAEPFAGGAGASLTLLFYEDTEGVRINDADPAIHDFWWTLVNRPQPFLDLLSKKRVSMAEWRRQRDIYRSSRQSRLRRGFSAFYLNRCNRSGIVMNGGPIGGVNQTGEWKLDARYNKAELRRRCEKVIEYRDRIRVSGQDGIKFIESARADRPFFFIDPPYFEKGPTLYLNRLDARYHIHLAELLESMSDEPWVLTYDDCPDIRKLYRGFASVRPFSLRYTASVRRKGGEVLITPRWMEVPRAQSSKAVAW